MEIIEYSVRKITRYAVTRFHGGSNGKSGFAGSQGCGEFYTQADAERVCSALASTEPEAKCLGLVDRASEAEHALGCCGASNKA